MAIAWQRLRSAFRRQVRASDQFGTQLYEDALRRESEQIIAALAANLSHPGCWFCARGTARGHLHIKR